MDFVSVREFILPSEYSRHEETLRASSESQSVSDASSTVSMEASEGFPDKIKVVEGLKVVEGSPVSNQLTEIQVIRTENKHPQSSKLIFRFRMVQFRSSRLPL